MIFIDPKLWAVASGKPLGNFSEGDIIQLNEGGVPVDFYVACHSYEQSLNGAGRTLVVRKDVYDQRAWHSSNVNAWASCTMRSWLNRDYKALLGPEIQEAMGTTTYRYTPGNGNWTVTTRSDAVLQLSMTELGKSHNYANVEGSALPIASTLRIAYQGGSATTQWTRSPHTYSIENAWRLSSDSNIVINGCIYSEGSRPAFTLPSDFRI